MNSVLVEILGQSSVAIDRLLYAVIDGWFGRYAWLEAAASCVKLVKKILFFLSLSAFHLFDDKFICRINCSISWKLTNFMIVLIEVIYQAKMPNNNKIICTYISYCKISPLKSVMCDGHFLYTIF